MKAAFLCEGDAEYESVPIILGRLGISYHLLKEYTDAPSPSCPYNVYRHNYKNVSSVKKQYLDFGRFLIDAFDFEKILVWCDNEKLVPVCEYAEAQKKNIEQPYEEKITLLLAVEGLEHWMISSLDALSALFDVPVDCVNQVMKKYCPLGQVNPEKINPKIVLKKIAEGTVAETWTKKQRACKFFSKVKMWGNETFYADSFTRFVQKIKQVFTIAY